MKKSLVALAALAATSAFAQSSVTIDGNADLGYRILNAPMSYADTKGAVQNGASTTAINLQVVEDIGGGTRATFRYEINPDLIGGTGFTGTSQGLTAATNGVVYTGANTGGAHQSFVGLSNAKMGGVKIGRINTGTLDAWGVASVFGTAVGSGYGSAGQYARYGATASTFWNTAPTRFNNSFQFETPNIGGVVGKFTFVPKVNQSSTDVNPNSSSLATTGNSGVSTTAVAASGGVVNPGVNRAGVQELALRYVKGPLTLAYANQEITYGDQGVNALVGVGPTATANTKHKLTTYAGNYNFGAATVYAGMWTEKQNTSTAVDLSGNIYGLKYTMGMLDLAVSQAKTNDKGTNNRDRKITGLGATYNLSKRTSVYYRNENRDANTNNGTDDATHGSTKTQVVGIRHTF
jgi:predicted porin